MNSIRRKLLSLEDTQNEYRALREAFEPFATAHDREMFDKCLEAFAELDIRSSEEYVRKRWNVIWNLIWNRILLKQQPHHRFLAGPVHSRQGLVLASIKCLRI
jgi:hypothetical protein